jgi:hypothetical protein
VNLSVATMKNGFASAWRWKPEMTIIQQIFEFLIVQIRYFIFARFSDTWASYPIKIYSRTINLKCFFDKQCKMGQVMFWNVTQNLKNQQRHYISIKCSVCGIALFAILTFSYYFSFSALFRTSNHFLHLFVLFINISFHLVLQNFSNMKTSEKLKNQVENYGYWEVLILWYLWLEKFWYCDMKDLGSFPNER